LVLILNDKALRELKSLGRFRLAKLKSSTSTSTNSLGSHSSNGQTFLEGQNSDWRTNNSYHKMKKMPNHAAQFFEKRRVNAIYLLCAIVYFANHIHNIITYLKVANVLLALLN